MRVLQYDNRKIDPILLDASSPEKEAAAYLALFAYLRTEWQVYADLEEPVAWDAQPSKQQKLYAKALAGDAVAVKQLLVARRQEEYEYWALIDVDDPVEWAKEWTA